MTDSFAEEQIKQIFQALGNNARLKILETLDNNQTVSGLHHDLGMSRSGLQKNIEKLVQANLVYRPEEGNQTYRLTSLGDVVAEHVAEIKSSREEIMDLYTEKLEEERLEEKDVLEKMQDSGVDTSELEQKIQSRAWVRTREEGKDTEEQPR